MASLCLAGQIIGYRVQDMAGWCTVNIEIGFVAVKPSVGVGNGAAKKGGVVSELAGQRNLREPPVASNSGE